MSDDKEYHFAVFHLLDRDTQKETITMMYPITRIEIPVGPIEDNFRHKRIFVVKDGEWHEISN